MAYRISFVFQAGDSGWSEQWYTAASVPPQEVVKPFMNVAFLKPFLALRAAGVWLVGIRANDVDVPRKSFLQIMEVNSKDYNSQSDPTGEEPAVAALGYVLTQTGKHRPVMVRGLTDSMVSRDITDSSGFSGALQNALSNYAGAIAGTGLAVRSLDPPSPANPDRLLVSMTPSATDAGATTYTFKGGPALIEGALLIAHGISRKYHPGYQGAMPGYNATAATIDVAVAWRSASTQISLRNAHVRNATYSIDPVATMTWETMRTKKVGRPTILPRGRRSAIAYRSP
jgi:hypothetical protein